MRRIAILVILLILTLYCLSFVPEGEGTTQQVDDFSLVQYKDNGERKWILDGTSAEVEAGMVKISEVSAVSFGKGTAFKLKARNGIFDRNKQLLHLENNVVIKSTDGMSVITDFLDWDTARKNVFTEAVVNIKKMDFNVDGKGAFCDLKNKTVELKRDISANIISSDDDLLQAIDHRQKTTITCDGPLEINYKKNQATFRNNVKIEDVQANILADRVDVYFKDTTGRVRCVVARGNVRILNGESVTYSQKAIYLVDQGRVILPKRPKLVIKDASSK